jgi:hypothetical protein
MTRLPRSGLNRNEGVDERGWATAHQKTTWGKPHIEKLGTDPEDVYNASLRIIVHIIAVQLFAVDYFASNHQGRNKDEGLDNDSTCAYAGLLCDFFRVGGNTCTR